ncbi:GtrA family protein [Psychrobacter sp. HD31]|uniref:GtrA family protein n=1 Tax=Psychrobacter sp. HD31 TaxID=3112003 RepID=UPI003DA313C0
MSVKKQAFWFLAVGATAALVHFLILVICVQYFSIMPARANIIAFLFAFLVSFGGHFSLTFSDSTQRAHWLSSFIKWFVSSIGGFLLNQMLFMIGLNWFGNHLYAVIWFIVTLLVTILTFALGKLWAFKG